jgi:hemerythrin
MAFFSWDEKYSVNIPEVDAQHKMLVSMVNDLFESMNAGKGKDILGSILSGLVSYSKTHFSTEERLMKTCDYPDYLHHKKSHDDFTSQALDLKKQFDNGNVTLSVKVGKFLKEWLINHILVEDKKYVPFLNGKNLARTS